MLAAVQSIERFGLSGREAQARLADYGPNLLPEPPRIRLSRRFVNQFRSPLIYILLFALVLDLTIWIVESHSGVPIESLAIAVILLINAGLGVYQEHKAEAALARLKAMAESFVWTIRDQHMIRVPAAKLVPGDLIRVESGARVPADGTLIETYGIAVDESILTGESLPVEKICNQEIFSGTLLTRGKGYAVVTRTGADSSRGSLAAMIGAIEVEQTPLEKRLVAFGAQIARLVLALAGLIAAAGLLIEGFSRIAHVVLFAVALAVAAVPEGLPAVLTLTLALGVERMARKKAVVRRLSAVESLGSVTIIATDKTGTLTENRIQVKDLDSPDTQRALRAMVLANDADHESRAGDPLEAALLDYASGNGIDVLAILHASPRQQVVPFDSNYKFMSVTVKEEDCVATYWKGAPEVLLQQSSLSDEERKNWEEKAVAYAAEGFRVLALAWCRGDAAPIFLGLTLLWDPPRAEVPEAIQSARAAGIRVVMVTGDHPATAIVVANEVGMPVGRVITGTDLETLSAEELAHAVTEANIFARVTPRDKLRLIETFRAAGEIVAVTGDGVNDAPALKRSDVGVAMGHRGSDVSREVADLVLLDDNFATIIAAIKEGRNIYENIQKFIRFLFSTNFSETLIIVGGLIGSYILGLHDEFGRLFLPLTASQLLWVNVVTDGPPALALGLDRDKNVLNQPPRDPRLPLLDKPSVRFILTTGSFKALVGGALLIGLPYLGYNLETTRTSLFLYMTIGQLVFAYPARRVAGRPTRNIALHLAVALGIVLQLLTIFIPALRLLLRLDLLSSSLLVWVGAAVLLSWAFADLYSRFLERRPHSQTAPAAKDVIRMRRVVVALIGVTLMIVGGALLILPGPGLLLISIGLAILGTEFVWARALLKKARRRVANVVQ